ncbi:YceI family protein [Halioglobus maricola]|uniref:YceI family protein n=1 Tax=Halioglobus maricola TaxID=2601894 RepID=A0A5P9NES8_9GAMM|nr:YceI family protein [Halioglobus maricola]QFU74237.1 YceI family protein [Halioglobus maricola]
MKGIGKFFGAVAVVVGMSTPALAQWELDDSQSSINFISVKNAAVAETHGFDSLMGYIGPDGNASVTINLDSVNTLIPIRDERLRELLFETAEFPTAQITALVDPAVLEAVADGGSVSTEIPLSVSLHGVEKKLTAPVVVSGAKRSLRVVSARPVIVSAADFALDGGVEALRAVASLAIISTAVPVTVNLKFVYPE